MLIIDCTSPATIAAFQGDQNRCKLVVACQIRYNSAGVLIPEDIKTACDKALADWKEDEAKRAAAILKPQEDEIRKLLKK